MAEAAPPVKALALHIGLNSVDPDRYGGWDGKLSDCENDARDMAAITRSLGYKQTVLLTPEATVERLVDEVTLAAKTLGEGDIFCLSYAGHGGQIADINEEEEDGLDETWCLWDRQFLDDEIYCLLAEFKTGVRVLVFSDSCHSGTVARGGVTPIRMTEEEMLAAYGTTTPEFRNMPDDKIAAAYRALRDRYDEIQLELAQRDVEVQASVRLLSGCQDNERSAEYNGNGKFTAALKAVWDDGNFQGDYDAFHKAILECMPAKQQPNHYQTGAPDPAFDAQRPFAV
jgi:hypothetical protein